MIFEAVAYAEGKKASPPYELQMAQFIKEFGSPWGGGWMEWPAGLASKMMTAQAYARAFQLYRMYASQKGWVDANQHIFRLVTNVWKWKKDAGVAHWWV